MDELMLQPWVGLSWEGWGIEQICITLKNLGADFEPYYFRTSDGYELDLLLKYKTNLWAIEMKLAVGAGGYRVRTHCLQVRA